MATANETVGTEWMITVDDVSVRFGSGPSEVVPLRGASVALDTRPTALTGPSGSGKTTLLRVIAGRLRPQSGMVTIGEQPVSARRDGTGDTRVTLVHQDYRLVEFLTVSDNLRLAGELRGLTISSGDVSGALNTVGLTGFEDRWPATLSGGEQQRVAVARALVCRAEVLLADEPTGALDEENTAVVADLLRSLGQSHDICVLIATHDRQVAASMERRLQLSGGMIVENGGEA